MFVERLADGGPLGSRDGDFVIVEWTTDVSTEWIAPLHVHHRDDEAWYVLAGTLAFRLGDDEFEAPQGSAVLAPAGTPHTFRNAGTVDARYLLVMTPKVARLIEALHEPDAVAAELFAAHDSELLADG
jgi:mannose-6-phosphate isomerase-like protein (cupin superfamily)